MQTKRALLVGLALICLLASAGCSPQPEPESELAELAEPEVEQQREQQLEQAVATRPDGFLPKVFDFREYLALYGKQYLSPAEFLNRMRLFFARAYRVFIRGVQFLYGRTLSFFALNEMSDWPAEQRRAMIGSGGGGDGGRHKIDDESAPALDMDLLEQELAAVRALQEEEGKNLTRTKRDIQKQQLEDLQELEVGLSRCQADSAACASGRTRRPGFNGRTDRLVVDHRNSGCMPPVRNQHRCGSCYAIAAITLYEYKYCSQSAQLVEFSEQYLLDCSRNFGQRGCQGGKLDVVGDFVRQHGLESRISYPYKAKDQACPYELQNGPDLQSMGRYRPNAEHRIVSWSWARMDDADLRALLESSGPVAVNIQVTQDFLDYGGGLDLLDQEQVQPIDTHSMVLVGHGHQDGQAYWLMRNSFGKSWGLKGYHKLDASSHRSNLVDIFQIRAPFELHTNPNHDARKLRKRLAKSASTSDKLFGWMKKPL